MNDLLEAIQIWISNGGTKAYPFHCEHDELYVYPGVAPEDLSPGDLERLEGYGFMVNQEFGGWISYKYGSC